MRADASFARGRPRRAFLSFAIVSGAGWLLDTTILLTLVATTRWSPAVDNVISSCTASLAVFLVTRVAVFRTAPRFVAARAIAYLCYVLVVIFVASFAVAALVAWIAPSLLGLVPDRRVDLVAATVAKVVVTPPQLALNFLVARLLAERVVGRTLHRA